MGWTLAPPSRQRKRSTAKSPPGAGMAPNTTALRPMRREAK
jgi:hypothetical protein